MIMPLRVGKCNRLGTRYTLIVTLPSASRVTAGTFGLLTFIRQSGRPDRYGKQRVLTSPRSNRTGV